MTATENGLSELIGQAPIVVFFSCVARMVHALTVVAMASPLGIIVLFILPTGEASHRVPDHRVQSSLLLP